MDYQNKQESVNQGQDSGKKDEPKVPAGQNKGGGYLSGIAENVGPVKKASNKGTILKKDQEGNYVFNENEQKSLIDKDFVEAHTNKDSVLNKKNMVFDKKRFIKKIGSSGEEFNKGAINNFAKWQDSVGLNPTARYDKYTRKTDFVLDMAESAERVGANNPALAAGQGILESGYKFKNSYNQGGVKATKEQIKNGQYTLDWTTEDLKPDGLLKKQKEADNDPKREMTPHNPGHKWYIDPGNPGKIHVQEYFAKYNNLDEYTKKHDAVVINILRNKISGDPESEFYEKDPSKVDAKLQEVLNDPYATLKCLQSGSRKGRYATSYDPNDPNKYVNSVSSCVKEAETIIARAKQAGYKGSNSGTVENDKKAEVSKPAESTITKQEGLSESQTGDKKQSGGEDIIYNGGMLQEVTITVDRPKTSEGHPIYYPKGKQDTLNRISWNKNQGYSAKYIASIQEKVETKVDAEEPGGGFGFLSVNAIRHYQEREGLSKKDGEWGTECADHAKMPIEKAASSKQTTNKTGKSGNSKTAAAQDGVKSLYSGDKADGQNKLLAWGRQYLGLQYVWAGKGEIISQKQVDKYKTYPDGKGKGGINRDKSTKAPWGTWGKRYDWLAKNHAGERAFDCSGFGLCAYREALGIDLGLYRPNNKSMATKYWNGQPNETDLEIGDIIRSEGHYVMYAGNGKAIESCDSGGVVEQFAWNRCPVKEVFRYL